MNYKQYLHNYIQWNTYATSGIIFRSSIYDQNIGIYTPH